MSWTLIHPGMLLAMHDGEISMEIDNLILRHLDLNEMPDPFSKGSVGFGSS